MKIGRFGRDGVISFGILDADAQEWVILKGDPLFAGYETTGERVGIAAVTLLAPVIPRSKIVAVGRNYREHAAEFGNAVPEEPMLFLKPNTAVIGPNEPIAHPGGNVDYEGELAVVIGRVAKRVTAANALDYVFGYTAANDVSQRDWQKSDGQWGRAKGFDTSCPLGPVIETEIDASKLGIQTRLGGAVRQNSNTALLVHPIPMLIEFISAAMTLLPGDVILTGTPAGVGRIEPGDVVEVEIEGIGILRNPVVAA